MESPASIFTSSIRAVSAPTPTKRYTSIKSREAFANNFGVNFPDWEWPAARPLKTSPCHDKMERHGAVFGATYGWEIPRWFAPEGVERKDRHSYRRSNYFRTCGARSAAPCASAWGFMI